MKKIVIALAAIVMLGGITKAQTNCTGPNWRMVNGQCVSADGRWYLGADNQPHQMTTSAGAATQSRSGTSSNSGY